MDEVGRRLGVLEGQVGMLLRDAAPEVRLPPATPSDLAERVAQLEQELRAATEMGESWRKALVEAREESQRRHAQVDLQAQTIFKLTAELERSREQVEELKEAEGRLIRQREELQQRVDMRSKPEWLLPAVIELLLDDKDAPVGAKSVHRTARMRDGSYCTLKAIRGVDWGCSDPISDAERQQHQRTVQDLTARLDLSRKRMERLEQQLSQTATTSLDHSERTRYQQKIHALRAELASERSRADRLQAQLREREADGAAAAAMVDMLHLQCQVPRDPASPLRAEVESLRGQLEQERMSHRETGNRLARLRGSIRGFARQHAP